MGEPIYTNSQIAGPKSTTEPQAGLFTAARDGELARQIVQSIIDTNADPDDQLLFNPLNWNAKNGTPFPANDNWLLPPVPKIINRRPDAFSQTSVSFSIISE